MNTYGAIKAARAAAAAGAGMFCYASTGNVYRPSLAALAENCPVRRDDPYALSKVAAEEALRLFAPHLPVIAVRLFGLFGPGQRKMLPVSLLEKVRSGQPITLEPAGDESGEPEGLTISFSYVEDTARCLRQLADVARDSASSLPAVLNMAGVEPISVRRFAATIGGILGIEPQFVRLRRAEDEPDCRHRSHAIAAAAFFFAVFRGHAADLCDTAIITPLSRPRERGRG